MIEGGKSVGYTLMFKMKNKKIAEKILELGSFLETPRLAEDIRKEIKDNSGYRFKLQDIRVNLLYLLRREKMKRKKEDKSLYKYYV